MEDNSETLADKYRMIEKEVTERFEKKDLERRLSGKPDWKHILPIYGKYKARVDLSNEKPTILDDMDPVNRAIYYTYQTVSTLGVATGIGYVVSLFI